MSARRCKRCGCPVVATEGDECEFTAGMCAFICARSEEATEEDQLIADALVAFSKLDDARKCRAKAARAERDDALRRPGPSGGDERRRWAAGD